jgi:penicillin-binding protein 1A
VVYESGEAGDWRPENSEGRFYGPTRLRDALARSRNLVSIRIMRSMGLADTRQYVERFGFPRSQLPGDLTMALGTASLTPLEVATGFAVFANGGYRVKPYLIDRVEDSAGAWLMQSSPVMVCRDCGRDEAGDAGPGDRAESAGGALRIVPGDGGGLTRAADVGGSLPQIAAASRAPAVISPANAFIITDMMRDVIRRGTGRRALALGRNDIAGKTGTTNERRDAWFSGFNANLVATVWVGFDQSRSLGTDEEGGRTALPMWVYFMREALKGHPESRLPTPDGVVTARVSPATGLLASAGEADAIFEYFLADHLPRASDSAADGDLPGQETQKPDEEPIF